MISNADPQPPSPCIQSRIETTTKVQDEIGENELHTLYLLLKTVVPLLPPPPNKRGYRPPINTQEYIEVSKYS